MKHLLFAILESGHIGEEILHNLSKEGYNGTVIPSTSLKHTLEHEGDIPMFFNLALFESNKFENNITLYLILDEEQIEDVKNIINKHTNHFKNCHGGMFVVPLESYEGSF